MNEDYLWDRSGEPEADVAQLEQLLGRLRWPEQDVPRAMPKQRRHTKQWWAMAAAILVLCLGATFLFQRMHTTQPMTSWQLSRAGQKPSGVRAGQVIDTSGSAQASMESEFVGEVQIEPNSRLRVMRAHQDEQRLALDHGTIHAVIWAPPTKFVVDTPSARTVDLGCEYTLSVANDGKGFLTVQTGWVAFQWQNIESFIPA